MSLGCLVWFFFFVFFFKQKTAYEISTLLEFRRVLFRSVLLDRDPGQLLALACHFVAVPSQVLLGRKQLAAGGEPLLAAGGGRSEEHTSELQSRRDLVCRLLLEKKKKNNMYLNMSENTQA